MRPFRTVGLVTMGLATLLAHTSVRAQGVDASNSRPATSLPLRAVRGTAYDSLQGVPLGGAFITITGTARQALSDSVGHFYFDSLPAGNYTFVMQHGAIDAIGLSGVSARRIIRGEGDSLLIAVPSFGTLWRTACGSGKVPSDSGFVFGNIRDAITQAPVANASVVASWLDIKFERAQGFKSRRWLRDVSTDSLGGYTLCGVPADAGLSVFAGKDSAVSGLVDLPPHDTRIWRRDILIGSIRPSDNPRSGRITGMVVDERNQPIPMARVATDGVPETRTDVEGRFTLTGVPIGSRQVEVISLGLAPTAEIVDVDLREAAVVTFHLVRVSMLDEINVTATSTRRFLVRDFDERRRMGLGHYADSTAIMQQREFINVFSSFANVRTDQRSGAIHLGGCTADIRLDGVFTDSTALQGLRSDEVAMVEVYMREMSVPTQYARPTRVRRPPCGMVIVWTKRMVP